MLLEKSMNATFYILKERLKMFYVSLPFEAEQ